MESLGAVLKDMAARGDLRLPAPSSESTADDVVEPILCPRCRGAGWMRRDVTIDHPDFGQPVRCDCPTAIESAQRAAGMFWPDTTPEPGGLWAKSFAAFRNRDGAASALESALAWAERPEGWLLLLGPSGTGKTHLLAAATNRLIERRQSPRYWPAVRLLGWLREGFHEGAEPPYAARLQSVVSAAHLVLDDVGAERTTDWVTERWQELIDARYAARLPTALSSNLTPAEIEDRLGLRIASRLRDGALCRVRAMTCDDYRPQLRRPE